MSSIIFGSRTQKMEAGKNWGNAANESIFRAAAAVLNKAANRVKQGVEKIKVKTVPLKSI